MKVSSAFVLLLAPTKGHLRVSGGEHSWLGVRNRSEAHWQTMKEGTEPQEYWGTVGCSITSGMSNFTNNPTTRNRTNLRAISTTDLSRLGKNGSSVGTIMEVVMRLRIEPLYGYEEEIHGQDSQHCFFTIPST
jgi:hypothetical protein